MAGYKRLLLLFFVLQAADVITTLVAIRLGGAERNSLISHLMVFGSLQGLLLSKTIVLALAAFAACTFRYRALRWANIALTGIVAWNLSVIARLLIKGT